MNNLINKVIQGDCLQVMKQIPDKSIDLVLTDPPYGIGVAKKGKLSDGGKTESKMYKNVSWDEFIPTKEYFDEMIRISKNQIIFGGNYFTEHLKPTNSWIFWNKIGNGGSRPTNSDGELAWTSFSAPMRIYNFKFRGMIQQDMKHKEHRYHPTQKPLEVMKWILQNYSKEGELVFDGFAGSGSTLIACEQLNRKWIGVEKNEDYIKDIKYRLSNIQQTLT